MFASKFTSHIWVNKKEASQIDGLLFISQSHACSYNVKNHLRCNHIGAF